MELKDFCTRIFMPVFIALLLVSCGEKTNYSEEVSEDLTSFPLPGLEEDEWVLGGKAFGIFHEVKDYSKWKPVFDSDESRRTEAGFQYLDILSSAENANNLAIFFKTTDHKSAKEFISDGLRDKMNEAGVVSVPSFIMYDLVFMTTNDYSSIPYRVAVSYKVKNFQAWLEMFTADRGIREKVGLLDIGVARNPDSPRMVYMMMAVQNIEDGQAFIQNESASENMSHYKVVGEPTFSLWRRAELEL
jgi:hypothetical protein